MTIRALATPWASPGDRQFSSPTSFMLKLALGEAPETIPAVREVARKVVPAATSIDGGAIDRIIGEKAGGFRVARLFSSAAAPAQPGCGHVGYDAIEQTTGMARTLVLRVPAGTPVGPLCETLAQITTVDSASPNYMSLTPFDMAAPIRPPESDAEAGWAPRRLVRLLEAHAIEPGDDGIMVGLIDSGIGKDHAEFARTFRAGYDTVRLESGDVAPGVELLGDHRRNDSNPEDRFVGHGMGCAGIIAAEGRQMPRGLGGACRIIPMRALAAARLPGKLTAVGLGAISDLDMAVKLAVDLGAKVINMSFGTDDAALSPRSPKPHADVVEYALARGCILVAASGNNGRDDSLLARRLSGGDRGRRLDRRPPAGRVQHARRACRTCLRQASSVLTTSIDGLSICDRDQLRRAVRGRGRRLAGGAQPPPCPADRRRNDTRDPDANRAALCRGRRDRLRRRHPRCRRRARRPRRGDGPRSGRTGGSRWRCR